MSIVINGSGSITGLSSGSGISASALSGQVPDANAPSGSVLQVVSGNLTSSISTTSTSYVDTGLSASITPLSTSSKILVFICLNDISKNDAGLVGFNIVRNGTTLIIPTSSGWGNTNQVFNTYGGASNSRLTNSASLSYLDSPASISALTYKIQYKVESGTGYLNQWGLNTDSSSVSTITLMEIAA